MKIENQEHDADKIQRIRIKIDNAKKTKTYKISIDDVDFWTQTSGSVEEVEQFIDDTWKKENGQSSPTINN